MEDSNFIERKDFISKMCAAYNIEFIAKQENPDEHRTINAQLRDENLKLRSNLRHIYPWM